MSVQLYNSLTKKKDTLPEPQEKKTIKMYSCGVTVYDNCHLGHARSLYIFDTFKRYLEYRGYEVHFVRNITDIDDKIINRAKELNKDWKVLVDEFITSYHHDLDALEIGRANKGEPRATENIEQIKADIQALIDKGYAYEVEGDVYYAVRQFKEYGKLSGQSIEMMQDAVRIEEDPKKKDPLDFALWKKSQEGEPFWPSPWGNGRPGWHIECSCMSLRHLNCETLDIHAGGRDLIFPHHENEIAQAEAISGKPFANLWMHHGLLTINGQKMAKSLGNFINIQKALEKNSLVVLKMFFLSSHYASPVDYNEKVLNDANEKVNKIHIFFNRIADTKLKSGINKLNIITPDFLEERKKRFLSSMDDDFNTAKALGHIFDIVNATNVFIDSYNKTNVLDTAQKILKAGEVVDELIINCFGLNFSPQQDATVQVESVKISLSTVDSIIVNVKDKLSEDIKNLLDERMEAREKKDFKRSDELRVLLREKGVIVEDTKDGQTWRKL